MHHGGFKNIGYNHSDGLAVYSYHTTHTLAECLEVGYFDDTKLELTVGDIVHVFCPDHSATLRYIGNNSCDIRTPKNLHWFDDADAATAITPIAHTGGDTDTYLTNDTLGGDTASFDPHGHSSAWNPSTGKFDFSEHALNDIFTIRVDLAVETLSNNQEFDILFSLAEGTAGAFELGMYHSYHKALGVQHVAFMFDIYFGQDVIDGTARLRFASADDANIEVHGWFTRVLNV